MFIYKYICIVTLSNLILVYDGYPLYYMQAYMQRHHFVYQTVGYWTSVEFRRIIFQFLTFLFA